jgi:hypothetical protein
MALRAFLPPLSHINVMAILENRIIQDNGLCTSCPSGKSVCPKFIPCGWNVLRLLFSGSSSQNQFKISTVRTDGSTLLSSTSLPISFDIESHNAK